MNRQKKLKRLYKGVGGINARWISDYQKIYNFPVGKVFSEREIVEIFDEIADRKCDFGKLKELIAYEQEIKQEFDTVLQQIKDNIKTEGRITSMNKLYKDLLEIMETIKLCYITINSFEYYEQSVAEVKEEVELRNMMHEGKDEFKKMKTPAIRKKI